MNEETEERQTPSPSRSPSPASRLEANRAVADVACISAGLGAVFGASLFGFWYLRVQLPIYVALLAVFHFLEFYITARYNPGKLSADSFLLNNGSAYNLAHACAFAESIVEYMILPESMTAFNSISAAGLALALFGQFMRSAAMIHASSNFSHVISREKEPEHQLVTSGVYRFARHPSYTGFFYWALGLQMFMLNPLSFGAFAYVLWNFFNHRIQDEERTLVLFFGEKYTRYRRDTPTRIPFIP
ncbi:protein-S-isoprenylcysteine O-methyltransferase [Trichomonascus vanleenenianus]|uniref:protein-S-isoprenylcysteine carboxyl O-methyltransferase n=1 Tax=Trichomonascus vanleenenianus TaxID=2268995 RepID=UPI003EC960A3